MGRLNERIVGEFIRNEDVIARQRQGTTVFMSEKCGCLGLKTTRAFVFDEIVGQYNGDVVTGKMGLNRDYMVQLTTRSGDVIEVDGTPRKSRDTERLMSYINEYIWGAKAITSGYVRME